MLFSKESLLERLDDEDYLEDRYMSSSRWAREYRLVFKHEDKFYASYYRVGATEYQDETPWDYEPDMIECPEVQQKEKIVAYYE